jgi:FMN phosphatase YigB (HAD superfamily)
MDRLGSSPEVTLFIDDLQENVNTARGLGMQAVLHTDNEKTIHAVDEILRAERL